MEAMIRTLSLDDMPGNLRVAMRMMRAPGTGWMMISVANIFLRKMVPDLPKAEISPEALAYYRSAYPTISSRKAILQWPRELPLDGKPADNAAVVEAYRQWLTQTDVPKLLFYGNAGIAIGLGAFCIKLCYTFDVDHLCALLDPLSAVPT